VGGRRIVMADGRRVIENLLDVEPIVAAINGDALGFAANVALLCDITVASETAKLATPMSHWAGVHLQNLNPQSQIGNAKRN
jgi:enoyl-CoA hydratase/carnithine racemase